MGGGTKPVPLDPDAGTNAEIIEHQTRRTERFLPPPPRRQRASWRLTREYHFAPGPSPQHHARSRLHPLCPILRPTVAIPPPTPKGRRSYRDSASGVENDGFRNDALGMRAGGHRRRQPGGGPTPPEQEAVETREPAGHPLPVFSGLTLDPLRRGHGHAYRDHALPATASVRAPLTGLTETRRGCLMLGISGLFPHRRRVQAPLVRAPGFGQNKTETPAFPGCAGSSHLLRKRGERLCPKGPYATSRLTCPKPSQRHHRGPALNLSRSGRRRRWLAVRYVSAEFIIQLVPNARE